jgi:protein-S-isoprenylcysteine O-methyltransferase Ste14
MPGNPLTDPNWAPDLADQITEFIGSIREKTTDKAVMAVRAVVFGVLALILGITTLVLAIVGAIRGLQALYDLGTSWEQAVYLSYFTLGGILTLIAVLLMMKRHSA